MFKLEKYPVIYKNKEYRVDIIESIHYQYTAIVYEKIIKKPSWFNKDDFEFIVLYKYNVGVGWWGKYIELAENAVKRYIQEYENKIKMENKHNEGIEEWNKWNGRIN
jgi:hypothetical protein